MVVNVIQFITVVVAVSLVLGGWMVGRRQKHGLAEETRASAEKETARLQELLALERMRSHREEAIAEPQPSDAWVAYLAEHRMSRPGRQGSQPEIH